MKKLLYVALIAVIALFGLTIISGNTRMSRKRAQLRPA